MRGSDCVQGAMFSYVDLEARIPEAHSLRKMKIAVDAILASMNDEFERPHPRRRTASRRAHPRRR